MKGIHRGDVTHHHDQSMLLVSLRIRNTTKTAIDRLTPEEAVFELSILFNYL